MELLYFTAAGVVAGFFGYIATKSRLAAVLLFAVWPLTCLLELAVIESLLSSLIASLMIVIAVVDLKMMVVPNQLVVAIAVLSILEFFLRIDPPWHDRLIGAAVVGGSLALLLIFGGKAYGRDVLGWGDVKLAAVCGLMLGWRSALLSLFIAALAAVLLVAVLKLLRRIPKDGSTIPFAPALAAGIIICRYCGPALLAIILP